MPEKSYDGACFCGAVTFTVIGAPEGMGYCHCASCRSWSAAPVTAFTLWKPDSLMITHGGDQIATYHRTDRSMRKFCKACGGHLMTDHPDIGLVDIYAAMLPALEFQPGLHVHYGDKVLSIPDGLPKFADLPGDLGGSGQVLPD